MSTAINIIKQPRLKVLDEIKNFTIEQLNEIPTGFNNNMMWNLGHMIATQQGLCYTRAGLPRVIGDDFFDSFKSGSKPERVYTEADLEQIKTLMFSTLEQLEKDLQTDMFANYPAWTTRYGVELNNIDEGVRFLPFHEGLHIGYIMSLRKVVKR